MKGLRTRVHPAIVVLTLAVVGLAIFMGYSRKFGKQDQLTPAELMAMRTPMPEPAYDKGLGVMITVSDEPKGDAILAFRPSAAASPLGMLGCFPGDVLVSVNGDPITGTNVRKAIEGLQTHGEPVSLIVYRQGRKIELKHTTMPTVPAADQVAGSRGWSPQPPAGE